MALKIRNRSFDGDPYNTETREKIAKILIEGIRERVIDSKPSLETGVARTVIPNYDINYFNFYESFVKNGKKEHPPKSPYYVGVTRSLTYLDQLKEIQENHDSLEMHYEKTAQSNSNIKKQKKSIFSKEKEFQPQEDTRLLYGFKTIEAPGSTSESQAGSNKIHLSKPTLMPISETKTFKSDKDMKTQVLIQEPASPFRLNLSKIRKDKLDDTHQFYSTRRMRHGITIADPEHALQEISDMLEMEKEATRPKVKLPKMLIKIRSNEDVAKTLDEDDEVSTSLNALGIITHFRPPPTVKSGLHFTTNNIGVLFRITKTMGKHKKFESTELIDKNLDTLKKIFGLHSVKWTVREITNQSLSRLGKLT